MPKKYLVDSTKFALIGLEAGRSSLRSVLFVLIFFALNRAYDLSRDSWFENFLIEKITVPGAAFFINHICSSANVEASGSRLISSGGTINVLRGCDGVDIFLMLLTAIIMAAAPARHKILGITLGSIFILIINQFRLTSLFYALRLNVDLFSTLHGAVAPVFLVILTFLYYSIWMRCSARRQQNSHHSLDE